MKPARTRSRWETASAPAGSSRRVGMNACDQRIVRRLTTLAEALLSDLGDPGAPLGGPVGVALDLDQLLSRLLRDGGSADVGGGEPRLDAFGGELPRLVQQGFDHLLFRHDPDDLALYEQVAPPPPGGDADVSFPGLSRPVDHASHHRHLDGEPFGFE